MYQEYLWIFFLSVYYSSALSEHCLFKQRCYIINTKWLHMLNLGVKRMTPCWQEMKESEYVGFAWFYQHRSQKLAKLSTAESAKEPAIATLLKLWPSSNIVADIRDVVRTKWGWRTISPVLSYTHLRFLYLHVLLPSHTDFSFKD